MSGHAGGLASFTDKEGYSRDIGGHIQFSHTTGYSAIFLAGMLAIIYVIRGVFTRSMMRQLAQSLARITYDVTCYATLFIQFCWHYAWRAWAEQSWEPKKAARILVRNRSSRLAGRLHRSARDDGSRPFRQRYYELIFDWA
jgi:hypothetical protein